jgi:hypothetical protein
VIRHARTALKETWLILITWCVFAAWVIGSCARAYQAIGPDVSATAAEPPTAIDPLVTVGGLPEWVFWGIAVPWMTATACTVIFALLWLKPEPATEEADA